MQIIIWNYFLADKIRYEWTLQSNTDLKNADFDKTVYTVFCHIAAYVFDSFIVSLIH